jgi:predicted metal-dependent hydrolase
LKRTARLDVQQLALAFEFDHSTPAAAAPPPSASPATDAADSPGRPRQRAMPASLAGEAPLTYRLRRAKRRTIGFQIDDHGLTISAPRWVRLADIEAAIGEKERWIRTKQAEWRAWRARRQLPEVRWADGGTLPFVGQPLTLRLRGAAVTTALLHESDVRELHLALPPDASEQQVRDTVQGWLQTEARRLLGERLALLGTRAGIRYAGWSLSSARSQWGSCTHDGRIRLSWRLVHFTLPVIDYVVAHELAHLQEMNHGPRFWSAVAALLPGFEVARDQIKNVDMASLPT